MFRSFFSLLAFLTILSSHADSGQYDGGFYSEVERATYDALVKANGEFVLAGPPHQAALMAYRAAVLEYSLSIKITSPSGDLKILNVLEQK